MTAKAKPDPLYYGRPTLKLRGWTAAMIGKFLGEQDLLAPNPHYRSSPPRKLYLIERVAAAEASDAFREVSGAAARRKAAAARAAGTKRAALLEYVEGLVVTAPILEREELIRSACDNYNRHREEVAARRAERRGWVDWDDRHEGRRPATVDSDPTFLERISVNFLRHALTSYEEESDRAFGRVGVREAHAAISRKVFDAIAEAYPFLAAECERQLKARTTEVGNKL